MSKFFFYNKDYLSIKSLRQNILNHFYSLLVYIRKFLGFYPLKKPNKFKGLVLSYLKFLKLRIYIGFDRAVQAYNFRFHHRSHY